MAHLETHLVCLKAHLGLLEAHLERLEAHLGRLEAHLGRLQARLGRLEAPFTVGFQILRGIKKISGAPYCPPIHPLSPPKHTQWVFGPFQG